MFLAKHIFIVCSTFKHFGCSAEFITLDADLCCFQCNLDKTDAVLVLAAFIAMTTCRVEKQEGKDAQERHSTFVVSARMHGSIVVVDFVASQSCSQIPKLGAEPVEFVLLRKNCRRGLQRERTDLSL